MSGDYTQRKQARLSLACSHRVGSNLDIYNYYGCLYSGYRSCKKIVKIFGQKKNIYNRNNIP